MRLEPTIIDEPTTEPVSVDEVRLASRISGVTEDALLDIYIQAARKQLEGATNRTVHQTTLEFYPPSFQDPYGLAGPDGRGTLNAAFLDVRPLGFGNSIELPRATPLIEIESVTLRDSTGVETIWDPAEYIADTRTMPGRLTLAYQKSWPQFTPDPVTPIRIRYTAGLASSPPKQASGDIKLLCLLMCGELYENRESFTIPERAIQQMLQLPIFARLIRNLRVIHEYSEI